MIIQIFSDLHADVSPLPPLEIVGGVDAVVVAGDTREGARNAFVSLRQIVPEAIPIAMVMGNPHRYWDENPAFDPAQVVEIPV